MCGHAVEQNVEVWGSSRQRLQALDFMPNETRGAIYLTLVNKAEV